MNFPAVRVVVALLVASFAMSACRQAPTKWEYAAIYSSLSESGLKWKAPGKPLREAKDLEELCSFISSKDSAADPMEAAGQEGWELVTVVAFELDGKKVLRTQFKRPARS